MTPRQSIILACIGLAVIILYVVYLGIYFGFSKPTKAQEAQMKAQAEQLRSSEATATNATNATSSHTEGVDTDVSCNNTVREAGPSAKTCPTCPKQAPCPACPVCPVQPVIQKKCNPDYDDAATRLTKSLMTSAKKVTTDQGLDDQYYHQLLSAIYKRFYTLNKTLLQEEESSPTPAAALAASRDKIMSLKFLEQLKREIVQYQEEEAKTPKAVGQAGGTPVSVSDKDVKTVLNSNEHSICTVYSCLA